jgi:hypothetical protein
MDHSKELANLGRQSLEIRDSVRRIERAVLGEPETGNEGLVSKAKANAGRIARLEKLGTLGAGAAAVIGLAWKIWTELRK